MYAKSPRKITSALIEGAWQGEECYIIGSGPSAVKIDTHKLIQGKKSIGVNLSFLQFKTDIVYLGDVILYEWICSGMMDKHMRVPVQQQWQAFQGVRCMLTPIVPRRIREDVYLIKRADKAELTENIGDGIYGGTNSGFGALMLAIGLGAKTINLIGFDFRYDMGMAWHKGYPRDNAKRKEENNAEYIEEMQAWAPRIATKGVNVVNLSPQSALGCFTKAQTPTPAESCA